MTLKEHIFGMLYAVSSHLKPYFKSILPSWVLKRIRSLKLWMVKQLFGGANFHFSHSMSQLLPRGVNLVGYTRTLTGIGEAGRSFARALDTTDVPFGIININPKQLFNNTDETWNHKERKEPVFNINLIVANADQIFEVYMNRIPGLFENRYSIAHWAWELPDFPDEWQISFRCFQEIWVGSSYTQEAVAKKAPVPVVTVPYSIEVKDIASVGRAHFKLPENRFLFLAMYDTYSFQVRKNPFGAISAFLKAFGKDDNSVGLVLKISNAEKNPKEWQTLQNLTAECTNIFLINESYNRPELNALLNCVDCFVSLHRAEGFGLVLAESMYLGKPVIGTNWSGNTEFMNSENSCAVNFTLVPVGQDYGPYKAEQIWAEPDLEHAAFFMKKLISDPVWARDIAREGQKTIKADFSPRKIGEIITQRLKQLEML